MDFSLSINPEDLARVAREALRGRLEAVAFQAGNVIVNQIKKRFIQSGDETGSWAPLWAGTDAQREMAFGQRNRAGDEIVRHEYELATKHLEKARQGVLSGKGKNPTRTLDRALARHEEARLAFYTGVASARAGGKPLDDTGRSKNSFGHQTKWEGDSPVVEITTTEFFLQYHDTGFRTKGPNFIPLTTAAKNKKRENPTAKPDQLGLVPGVDYIMAWAGVTVPQRRLFHFTPANSKEIADTLSGI